ncbi:MAG: type II toxin-antitoxin system VapC family toxin [Pseudomonadota bacterium]
MKFLLDTNAVIAILKGHEPFLKQLRAHRPADFGIPSIVAHELFFGAYKSHQTETNLRKIEGLLLEILEFDGEDARHAGALRASLSARGAPIGPYDVLIAGQAMARDLTLITHNTREFHRIDGLRVEDWER